MDSSDFMSLNNTDRADEGRREKEGSVGQGISNDVPEDRSVNGLERAMQLAAEAALNADGGMGVMAHGKMSDSKMYSRQTEYVDAPRSSAPVGRHQPRSRRLSMQQDWCHCGDSHGYRYDTGSVSSVRISSGNHEYEELGPPAIIRDADGQEYLVQPVRESLDIYRDSSAMAQTSHASDHDMSVYRLSNGLYTEGETVPIVQDDPGDLFTPFGVPDGGHQGVNSTPKRHSLEGGKSAAEMLQQYKQGSGNVNMGGSIQDDLMEALRKASLSTGGSMGRPDVLQAGSPSIPPSSSVNGGIDVGHLYRQGLMSRPPSISCPVDPEFRTSLLRKRTSKENSGTLRNTSNELPDQSSFDDTERLSDSSLRLSGGVYDPRQRFSFDQNSVNASRAGTSIYTASEEGASWEIDMSEIQFGPRIGIGAYGEVFRGLWRQTDVAVKLLLEQDLPERIVRDFKREVSIMKKLRHPNILQLMGACTTPPNLCIVSEYVSKGSLFKILHKSKEQPLSMERKIRIALDAAKGIHYLHTCRPPIIHGDLKSPNLLLDRNDVVKVCDFGLSRVKISSKFSVASKMGTPEWTAPEVLKSESCSEASDTYSFGVVLWELLTGRVPWSDKNPMQVVLSVGLNHERLPIPENTSPRLQGILAGCFGNSHERPSFDQIIHTLKVELREVLRAAEDAKLTTKAV
eukprot:jgi/Picsp_1/2921/NSC_01146-R1_flag-tagged protein kinase domain of mitogen-activated protein kinase kinase kinase